MRSLKTNYHLHHNHVNMSDHGKNITLCNIDKDNTAEQIWTLSSSICNSDMSECCFWCEQKALSLLTIRYFKALAKMDMVDLYWCLLKIQSIDPSIKLDKVMKGFKA